MKANPTSNPSSPLPHLAVRAASAGSARAPDMARAASRARRSRVRSAVICALSLTSTILRLSAAHAGAPPLAADREADSFDLFLDRAGGDRVTDEPIRGSFLLGATASLAGSSSSSLSFGLLGFVQVPLDRFSSGSRAALVAPVIADRPSAATPRSSSATARLAPVDVRVPADPPSLPAPPAPAPEPPAPLLTPALARGAVAAACKAAKLDEADARLDALASRAKTSALLPELRLRATRAIDETESLAPTEYDPSRRTATGSATTWLEARATFRLDRLVFADDEIAVERQRSARAAERTKLVSKVLDLLDAWQRARFTEADPEAKADAKARATLSAASAEASLDVLTNGWFSKAIAADADAPSASRAPRPAAPAAPPSSQLPGRAAIDSPDRSASK